MASGNSKSWISRWRIGARSWEWKLRPDPLLAALVLAGGRSQRLGEPKARLMLEGQSLLQRTLAAVHCETSLVTVVGPPDLAELLDQNGADSLVREDPPFAGPAAAVAAGLAASPRAEWMLVLACDMPQVCQIVSTLVQAVLQADFRVQALVAYDGGRQQPLAACYRRAALAHRVDELRARGELSNLSMRALIASLEEARVDVPAGSTADVDTWAQAAMWGIRAGEHRAKGHADDAGDNSGTVDG